MNTCKALLFILLAWSTTQLTPNYDNFNSENDPITQAFSDTGLHIPDFNLLFNGENAEETVVIDVDSFIDNMQMFSLDTNLSEENIEEAFFSVDISTPFGGENREEELSLDDFITPSEEVQEILAFIDQLSGKNNNVEALLQENDFFQSLLNNFNEELVSLLAVSISENTENAEEIIVLPSATSGIAFAMVDGLNGIEGEEEKGEENLEAKYNLALNEDRFNLAGESKSFNIYLGAFCLVLAAGIVGVIAKGLSMLRKHETVSEEDTGANYVEISDE